MICPLCKKEFNSFIHSDSPSKEIFFRTSFECPTKASWDYRSGINNGIIHNILRSHFYKFDRIESIYVIDYPIFMWVHPDFTLVEIRGLDSYPYERLTLPPISIEEISNTIKRLKNLKVFI